ncbi:MAG: hypothetical protein JWL83_169 [Actinomycetia bacterium]|nr:hypothetical protein [Actinomycetes bacterium]
MSARRIRVVLAAAFVVAVSGTSISMATSASAHSRSHVRAHLTAFQETPSLNSTGHGDLQATVTSTKITFKLTYAGLTGAPLVAHIHVGQRGVAGGVALFLCGGGGQSACPATTSGTITGTATAMNVVGPTTQGFNAGDLASVRRAIKGGVTYANVHTPMFPMGEIRGQISDQN